jgi:hypothetical protein
MAGRDGLAAMSASHGHGPHHPHTIGIDMKKSLSALLWTLVFIALLLGLDQFFLHIPATVSPHQEAQTFYLDLRARLLLLGTGASPEASQQAAPAQEQPRGLPATTKKAAPSAPAVQPQAKPQQPGPAVSVPTPTPGPAASSGKETTMLRYIYVDKAGDLHFADSLQEVPAPYRAEARPMSR